MTEMMRLHAIHQMRFLLKFAILLTFFAPFLTLMHQEKLLRQEEYSIAATSSTSTALFLGSVLPFQEQKQEGKPNGSSSASSPRSPGEVPTTASSGRGGYEDPLLPYLPRNGGSSKTTTTANKRNSNSENLATSSSAKATLPVTGSDDFDAILQQLPVPVQVMEQYRRWHSVDALRSNPHNRTYALAFYTCPYSAGNRIHEFVNGKCTWGSRICPKDCNLLTPIALSFSSWYDFVPNRK